MNISGELLRGLQRRERVKVVVVLENADASVGGQKQKIALAQRVGAEALERERELFKIERCVGKEPFGAVMLRWVYFLGVHLFLSQKDSFI